MGLKHLSLVLDFPEATYRPGDVVSGKVLVGLHSEKKVNEIYMKLKGVTQVKWTESHSRTGSDGKSETVWETYSARETHVDRRVTLLVGAGRQEMVVPAGDYVYPFSTTLPLEIPPSFEGDHGHVRYSVKAKVDRPWRVNDEVVVQLKVTGDVDLNLQPGLKEPARRIREKTLCCCCCRSGPLTLILDTPVTGIVLGGSVDVGVEVDNATSSRVDLVVCKLTQKVEFKAEGKTKTAQCTVASIDFGSVEPRRSLTSTRALTIAQDLPPTGLPHCSIIKISYYITGKAKFFGPHVSPSVEIPVVLGNIDFRDRVPFPVPEEPSAPPLAWDAPPPLPPPEVPPPSYEESVFGTPYMELPGEKKA